MTIDTHEGVEEEGIVGRVTGIDSKTPSTGFGDEDLGEIWCGICEGELGEGFEHV